MPRREHKGRQRTKTLEAVAEAMANAKTISYASESLGYVGSHRKLPPGKYTQHTVTILTRESDEAGEGVE